MSVASTWRHTRHGHPANPSTAPPIYPWPAPFDLRAALKVLDRLLVNAYLVAEVLDVSTNDIVDWMLGIAEPSAAVLADAEPRLVPLYVEAKHLESQYPTGEGLTEALRPVVDKIQAGLRSIAVSPVTLPVAPSGGNSAISRKSA